MNVDPVEEIDNGETSMAVPTSVSSPAVTEDIQHHHSPTDNLKLIAAAKTGREWGVHPINMNCVRVRLCVVCSESTCTYRVHMWGVRIVHFSRFYRYRQTDRQTDRHGWRGLVHSLWIDLWRVLYSMTEGRQTTDVVS